MPLRVLRRTAIACALAAAALADAAVASVGVGGGSAAVSGGAAHPEARLSEALAMMRDGRYGEATRALDGLVRDQPTFRLAQLLYGQALALRSGARIGSPLADEDDPRLKELLAELHQRSDSQRALPAQGLVPSLLLQLSPETRHALVVDLSRGRAYLVENDGRGLRTVRNLYAGIGRSGFGKQSEGDLRTPIGIYRTTGWLPGDRLPPLYGAGALPLNYPNSWDRALGRTGSGIWLHGVPRETYVRAPRSSEGCVTFSNDDLMALKGLFAASATPVLLAESIDWQPAARLGADRDHLVRNIEQWRRDWSTLATERYLAHYADEFRTDDGMGKAAFADYKRRVNAGKRRVDVNLRDLSLFAYPGEANLVVAQFVQNYVSDNFASTSRKDQYWRRQPDGQWKIIRELNR